MIAVLFLIYVCNHSYEVVYGLEKAIYLCRLGLWKQLFIIVLFIYLCRLLLRKEYFNLSGNKRYRNHNTLNLLDVRQVPLLLFVKDV